MISDISDMIYQYKALQNITKFQKKSVHSDFLFRFLYLSVKIKGAVRLGGSINSCRRIVVNFVCTVEENCAGFRTVLSKLLKYCGVRDTRSFQEVSVPTSLPFTTTGFLGNFDMSISNKLFI